jgi:hypothetical protein
MKTSKHALARMSQRGITKNILETVLKFGECDNGGVIVTTYNVNSYRRS